MKLNFYGQSEGVRFIMKTGQDNDVTNHKGVVYVEIETKLSWLLR